MKPATLDWADDMRGVLAEVSMSPDRVEFNEATGELFFTWDMEGGDD